MFRPFAATVRVGHGNCFLTARQPNPESARDSMSEISQPWKLRANNIAQMDNLIDFGDVLPEVNEILQRGVSLYRRDPVGADLAFREALALRPDALPSYLCLYKIHTYQGNLDEALAIAEAGLEEAARQAGLDADWTLWRSGQISSDVNGPGHFALYTLKALAFIHLRRDEKAKSQRYLDKISELGAMELVGGTVIAALAAAVD
ncbi:conserved hypothetical protein [Methylocella tundrae]|uniref:Tetratricopeptide repeat protein n=2 Tax=Methylocella tundrae TaxID=227605 RepID=A0A8B6M163_METTU|nr:conserved hypothetical protein [Methylocella tundrae]